MSENFRLLSSEEMAELFGKLLDRLANRGVSVETYIIGGVAMAIHLGREELTPDIDGLFTPQDEVFAEAAQMAEEYNLKPDWVNSNSRGFVAFDPADDVDAVHVELHGHPVTVASKRLLLAMKIAASRAKDRPDLSRLIIDLGITNAEEIVDLAFSVFGEYSVVLAESRDEVRLVAQEALNRAAIYANSGDVQASRTLRGLGDVGTDTYVAGKCGFFMPRARTHCVLKLSHRGHHRSRTPRQD